MLAVAAARREAALKSELQALKLGQLCTRATNDGIDALTLEQAQDSDTPKEAVIALLLKAAAEQATETPRQQKQSVEQPPADHVRASSSPASNPTEPSSAGDSMAATVSVDGKTTDEGRSATRGRKSRKIIKLNCPQCSEEFKAHAHVKQKRTRKSRCGGKTQPMSYHGMTLSNETRQCLFVHGSHSHLISLTPSCVWNNELILRLRRGIDSRVLPWLRGSHRLDGGGADAPECKLYVMLRNFPCGKVPWVCGGGCIRRNSCSSTVLGNQHRITPYQVQGTGICDCFRTMLRADLRDLLAALL